MTKLTSDAKFEDSDIKASIAALSFIFSSAAKHSVDGDSLDNELQQLGLPKGKERGPPLRPQVRLAIWQISQLRLSFVDGVNSFTSCMWWTLDNPKLKTRK